MRVALGLLLVCVHDRVMFAFPGLGAVANFPYSSPSEDLKLK